MKLLTQQMKQDSTSGHRGSGEPDKARISTSESVMKMPLSSLYDRNEKEKKRKYNIRVMTVEQGTLTQPVFSVGTATPECQVFLKQLC